MICKTCAEKEDDAADLEDNIQEAWLLRELHHNFNNVDWDDESDVKSFAKSDELVHYIRETQNKSLNTLRKQVIADPHKIKANKLKSEVKALF